MSQDPQPKTPPREQREIDREAELKHQAEQAAAVRAYEQQTIKDAQAALAAEEAKG